MPHRLFFCIFFVLLTFASPAQAFQGYTQHFGQTGTINWGSGKLSVVYPVEVAPSEGTESEEPISPMAIRKAVSKARKQLLDMVLSTRIDARQTVGAYLSGDDTLAAQVRGLIQNSLYEGPVSFEENGTVQVGESFRDKLAELVLPTLIQFQSGIAPKMSTSTNRLDMEQSNEPEAVGGGRSRYTGIIVDARGLKVTPSLAPVIYGQDGFGAYGPFLVSRAGAIAKGVAAYATTADPLSLKQRVGDRPLTVRAFRAYGSWQTDLVISSVDAALIRAIVENSSIAEHCRVVIVVDAPVTDSDQHNETDAVETAQPEAEPEPGVLESDLNSEPVEGNGDA